MLQLVQSSAARPAGGYFSGFVPSGIEAAKPAKFVAYREGGLKGRLQARLPAARKANAEKSMFTAPHRSPALTLAAIRFGT
jgi:hypothetical protein